MKNGSKQKSRSKWSFHCRIAEARMLGDMTATAYKDHNARNFLHSFPSLSHSSDSKVSKTLKLGLFI